MENLKRKRRKKTADEVRILMLAFRENPLLDWHKKKGLLRSRLDKLSWTQIQSWWSSYTKTRQIRRSTNSVVPYSGHGHFRDPRVRLLNSQQEAAFDPEIERLKVKLKETKDKLQDTKDELQNTKCQLKDMEAEFEFLNNTNTALLTVERECNADLQEARKKLFRELEGLPPAMFGIGVKRMGALESQLFVEAFERKYGPGLYDDQAAMMCSRWEGYIKDPNWHPYTYIEEGNSRRVVPNENDKRLRMLRRVYGRKLYNPRPSCRSTSIIPVGGTLLRNCGTLWTTEKLLWLKLPMSL